MTHHELLVHVVMHVHEVRDLLYRHTQLGLLERALVATAVVSCTRDENTS